MQRSAASAAVAGQAAVADTSNTAAVSKRCAAQLGYIDDPFAEWFDRSRTRCAPIINRGTFVRVAAIDAVCDQFAPTETADEGEVAGRQILSLGAGLDTRAWRIRRAGRRLARYIEVDFAGVCARKRHLVRSHHARSSQAEGGLPPLTEVAEVAPQGDADAASASELAAPADALVSADLSDLDSLRAALAEAHFDPSLPTLVLIECVLVYMAPEAGSALLSFLAGYLADAACLAYEMIRPDDAFGRQMRSNLESRGLRIPGIDGCADTQAHEARFAACGWTGCQAVDMLHWYERVLPHGERQRVERLEWLDELEEWRLLLSHYCFVLAHTQPRAHAPVGGGEAAPAADGSDALPARRNGQGGWAAALSWAPHPGPGSAEPGAPVPPAAATLPAADAS